jgi:hypothetical protein
MQDGVPPPAVARKGQPECQLKKSSWPDYRSWPFSISVRSPVRCYLLDHGDRAGRDDDVPLLTAVISEYQAMHPKPRKDLSVLFLSDKYQQIGNGRIFFDRAPGRPIH